jgi:hypothetical protein
MTSDRIGSADGRKEERQVTPRIIVNEVDSQSSDDMPMLSVLVKWCTLSNDHFHNDAL